MGTLGGPQQFLNQSAQGGGSRRLNILLIGAEHAFERIDGREDDLGKLLAVRMSDLRRENVFEFVRNFTEFRKTAGSGISLERMNSAPDAANKFLIRGTLFELQTGIIDGLEKLARALKEESPKLRTPLIGKEAQEFTSMRL